MNKVGFLGLTNKEPVTSKVARINQEWQKENPKIFERNIPEKEECSQGAALSKLHELGFKAHCQMKGGKQVEIKPNFWQEGQPLHKGPELYKGIEEGYYKLTKVPQEVEKGANPQAVQASAEKSVWDSSNFTYAEIQAKIAEVEAKYAEIVAQKEALLQTKQVDEFDEGFFSKEVIEFEKVEKAVKKQNNLQIFS